MNVLEKTIVGAVFDGQLTSFSLEQREQINCRALSVSPHNLNSCDFSGKREQLLKIFIYKKWIIRFHELKQHTCIVIRKQFQIAT
jgi:ribonuclease HIII